MIFKFFLFPILVFAATDQEVMSIEEFLQKLSTVPDVVTRKDPFVSPTAPFEAMRSTDVASNAPVLERYPIAQYTIVATLLGDQYPRALVRLPAQEGSKVLIVKEKDKMGQSGGIISKILSDGLVVQQTIRTPLGFVEKSEVVLRIGVAGGDAKK
jgi:Tfp pilus assembly protein PilP